MLAETGFIGFIVFIILITVVLRSILTSVRILEQKKAQNMIVNPGFYASAQAVLLGLFSFMVSGTFLTQAFTWPLYILIALTVAISRMVAMKYQH